MTLPSFLKLQHFPRLNFYFLQFTLYVIIRALKFFRSVLNGSRCVACVKLSLQSPKFICGHTVKVYFTKKSTKQNQLRYLFLEKAKYNEIRIALKTTPHTVYINYIVHAFGFGMSEKNLRITQRIPDICHVVF